MTNSTRLIGLIMTAAMWAGTTSAQGLSEWDDTMPPGLTLPLPDDEGMLTPPGPRASDESMLSGPSPGHDQAFDAYHPDAYHPDAYHPDAYHPDAYHPDAFHPDEYAGFAPGLHDHWHGPTAPIESTGTWLRRGFWYAEAEAVVFNRLWNRDNKLMAAQDAQVQQPAFFSPLNPFPILNTNRVLFLDGAHPGQDTAVRATLGHFLFRDSRNRDHTIEFTAFGGGDWVQDRLVQSTTPFGLFVPFYIDAVNRSFDGSTRQTIAYSSHYSSFEGNYRVRQRMRRDQIVMDANGHWHRAANPGFVRDYLVGLRMVEARDILDWRAEDIQVLGDDGAYSIRTDNDMVGLQLGVGFTYEASRWSLGVHSKGGVYLNDALGRVTLDFTADDDNDANLRLVEDQLSFIGETKVLGRWHLTPSFSVRAAYEVLYFTSQALAPNQATFVTELAYLNTSQDPFYHGASFGFEGYW